MGRFADLSMSQFNQGYESTSIKVEDCVSITIFEVYRSC